MEELSKAISCYEKAIQIDSNYINAYNNLGIILGDLNRLDEAKKYLEKSLNVDPNAKKTNEGYGNLLLKLNQHNKAIEYIRKGTGLIEFTQKNFEII